METELLFKIVAALGAATWAVALLFVLRKPALATIELRRAQSELNTLQLQAEIERQKEAISVDIKPTVHSGLDSESYIICAVVELINAGSRIKRLKWTGELPPFSVRRVRFRDDGVPDYDKPLGLHVPLTQDPTAKAVSHVIRSGGKESISFALKVTSGLYLLSFRGVLDEEERVESKHAGADLPVAWTCNKYVFVGETQLPSIKEADS